MSRQLATQPIATNASGPDWSWLLGLTASIVWTLAFCCFANGRLGTHVETHQIIGVAAFAGVSLILGRLPLRQNLLTLGVLVFALALLRQPLTDAVIVGIGFLLGWQSSSGDRHRQNHWRRGLYALLLSIGAIATLGSWTGSCLAGQETRSISLFAEQWLFGQLNMTAMWVGIAWAISVGISFQLQRRDEVARACLNEILLGSLAVIILHLVLSLMAETLNFAFARQVQQWSWLGSLALLWLYASARRTHQVPVLLASCCVTLVATFHDRGQTLLSVVIVSFMTLVMTNVRQRKWWVIAGIGATVAYETAVVTLLGNAKAAHLDYWALAWSAFSQRPVWGWGNYGLGQAAWHNDQLRAVMHLTLDSSAAHAHSIALNIIARAGLIGASCYFVLLVIGVWRGLNSRNGCRWPILFGLGYLHIAGSVSRVISTVPGLILWGALLGALFALPRRARKSSDESNWAHRAASKIALASAVVLLLVLICRSWWGDHVASHPEDFLRTSGLVVTCGDPLFHIGSKLGLIDANDQQNVLAWRTAWTLHTENTSYKTILSFTQSIGQQIAMLDRALQSRQSIGPSPPHVLTGKQRTYAKSTVAPAVLLTSREGTFLGEVDTAFQQNFFEISHDQLRQVRDGLLKMGVEKVVGGLGARNSSEPVRRAVCCLTGWHIPEIAEVQSLLKDLRGAGTLALVVLLEDAYRQRQAHASAETLRAILERTRAERLTQRDVILTYLADRVPRRNGYLFRATSTLDRGMNENRPELIESAMHGTVKHLLWAPLEFRWKYLQQYKAIADAAPDVFHRVLREYDDETAALAKAACNAAYADLATSRRLAQGPWRDARQAGFAILSAIHHFGRDPEILTQAIETFAQDPRFGRKDAMLTNTYWTNRDWQLRARQ